MSRKAGEKSRRKRDFSSLDRTLLREQPRVYNTRSDLESLRTALFVSIKNIFDSTYIVDRACEILPSSPGLVHAGLKFDF